MNRQSVLEWFERNPGAIHGDLESTLERCERAVRRHAREDAWLAAKAYVAKRRHDWEDSVGAHASEAYVARVVCHQLADELERHEPSPQDGDEDHLVGGPMKAAFDEEGWSVITRWIMTLARQREHESWQEIVSYTDHLARDLIRKHHLSDDSRFHYTQCYGEVASRIAALLERDYTAHAFPHE